jgi:chromosome partitioning protein
MYVIAVTNDKGGVAKTTTAVSLGAAFVEKGLRTLLIDLDSQSGLCRALNIDTRLVKKTITDLFLKTPGSLGIMRDVILPGLDLIPSDMDAVYLERYLPTQRNYEMILEILLENPVLDHDFVVLDCPPFLGALTVNAMVAANLMVVPTQAEYLSIQALGNLMRLLRKVRLQNNPLVAYRLLLTMYDSRIKTHRLFHGELRSSFNDGMFKTEIDLDARVRESTISGLPVLNYAPKSRAARQYRELAQEILTYARNAGA